LVQLSSVTDREGLAEEQAALRRVATLVAQGADADDVFSAVTKEVAGLFDAAAASLSRYESDSCLVVAACRSGFPVGSRWPLNLDSLAARVLATGQPVYVDDYSEIARQLPGAHPVRPTDAAIGVPIVADGSLWGVLVVGAPELNPARSEIVDRVTAFSELVATAIANAETRRKLERVAAEQQALRAAATLVASGASPTEVFAAITTSASEVFGVLFASLIRVDPAETATMVAGCAACSGFVGTSWAVPADDPGITRTVLTSRRPARIEDHSGVHGPLGEAARALGIGSVVGAPVIVDGSVWGVLAVGAAHGETPLPPDAGDRLVGFTELVTTTLINAETRDSLRRLAGTQASLRRVATIVAEGATADELLSTVAREVSVVLGAPMVNVDRYELEGGSPVSVVVASLNDPHVPVGSRWPLDGPSARAWIYETGRPTRIDDYSGLESTAASAAREQGVRWAVGAPIVVDGVVWGAIHAGTTGDEPVPDDAESRLADFTELVSTAVANSEAREKIGGLLDEQAALRRVATLVAAGVEPDVLFAAVSDEVAQLFASDGAAIARLEPGGSGLVAAGVSKILQAVRVGARIDLDEGLASTEVYRSGRAARRETRGEDVHAHGAIGDMLRGLSSFATVAAPIKVEGSLWGTVITFSGRTSFPSNTEERLEKFGELVATAIANAESRNELAAAEARARALAEEQAALRRVATLVAHGVSPEELFAAVSDEVATLVDAEITTIGRFDRNDPHDLTVVGVKPGFHAVSIGTRSPQMDWLASSVVYRTGHTARKDVTAAEITDAHPVADAVRALGFFSTVSAPIVVEGELWGVVTASSSQASLPPDTERRVESFGELVATALANAGNRAELAASEARARALAEEQAALRRVATLVAESPSSEDLFSAVAREVATVLTVSGVLVERFDTDGTVVALGVAYDSDLTGAEPFFGVGTRMPRDPGSLAAQVVETHRPARIDDYSGLRGTIGDAARAAGLGSGVAGPILVDGELWGQMCVFSRLGTVLPAGTEDRLHDFIELLATAISNYEAHAALQRLADEQASLRRIATLVAEGAAPKDLFDSVRREVAEAFDVPFTVLWRFDPDGLATVLATDRNYLDVGSRWPTEGETNVAARVRQTGRAARVDFTAPQHAPGSVADAARRAGIRSGVGVPIVVEGELWGSMNVGSERVEPLPADLETRLEKFTELLATALSNADSRAELADSEARARALADEQAALRRVATLVARDPASDQFFSVVAREVAVFLNVAGVIVTRYEPDGTAVVLGEAFGSELSGADAFFGVGSRAPLDPGSLAAQVFETRGTARIDDFATLVGTVGDLARAARFGCGCAAPIVVKGELWGKMCVFSETGTVLPIGTEERLHDFIELVVTAISNYEAHFDLAASEARARELANEQAALRRVATLVAQGASPDELFSAVADEVAGVIDIPAVGVHRYEADGTFTMLGLAGETNFTVGSRWPVDEEGIAGMILATGRPARRDDHSTMPGRLGEAMREDLMTATVGVPIVVEGRIWGLIVAAAKPGKPIPTDAEERLARFTELLATAVSNATTRSDLLTSRARVVSAADETRRRLERDLHDGIQQWLVALALKARKAAGLAAAGEWPVQELSGLADDLIALTDELRELSRGIHPAILSDAGLDDALKALARRSAIPVDLDVSFQGRYDPTLEATVYYVVAESITNAVKHAQASSVAVHGGLRGEAIELEIEDNGVGGADPRRGTGLIGLKDRVDTLGGTISFASPAGAGTKIRLRLPAGPRDREHPPLQRSDEAASTPASG
jgi:GAF domain-containing protein